MSDDPHAVGDVERPIEATDELAVRSAFDAPGRSPALVERLNGLVEVLLCSDYPTQFAVAQVLALAGMTPFTRGGGLSARYVFALELVDSAVLILLVLWLLRLHGESARDLLFGGRRMVREAGLGLLLIPAVFLMVVLALGVLQGFTPSLHNVARNPLEALISSRGGAWMFSIVAVVGGGMREEIQRAFVLRRFERYLGGAPLGLVLFSLVFGSGHIIQGWDVAITTAALGLFWGIAYLARRSAVAPMVSHAGFNLAQIIRYTLWGP